jgi:hypothetical protein
MSLQALTDAVVLHLERTRELFGAAPQAADWTTTSRLETARDTLAAQNTSATSAWQGESGAAHRGAADATVAALDRVAAADLAAAAPRWSLPPRLLAKGAPHWTQSSRTPIAGSPPSHPAPTPRQARPN